jgi:hypothetical protein
MHIELLPDAWDLPPMDYDGKADPYVEVSLRPGHNKKFTTAIKTNSLNPTFNETFEFHLKSKEIEGPRLVYIHAYLCTYIQLYSVVGVALQRSLVQSVIMWKFLRNCFAFFHKS